MDELKTIDTGLIIQTYKEHWVSDFNQIKKVLEAATENLAISIEHIGSTAVPGLAAKPIIDIDIIFSGSTKFDDVRKRLEKIGYYHHGNQGIVDREVFKRGKRADIHNVLDSITHHLYVCRIDSEELKRHILFRDYLIGHERARMEYQNLKYQIAAEAGQDRKEYARLKELKAKDFVNSKLIVLGGYT